MVTLDDVAGRAGVCRATVSLVMNDKATAVRISQSTRKQVLRAAEELNYHPNVFARALRTNRSFALGIMVCDIADPYCAPVIRGAEEAITSRGYHSVLSDLQNNAERLREYIRLFRRNRLEGVLLIANSVELYNSIRAELDGAKMRLAVIGGETPYPDVPSVSVDNVKGAYQACKHLIDLGHREIGYIVGPRENPDSELRLEGWRMAAEHHGLELDPELVVREERVDSSPRSGYESMTRLLEKGKTCTAVCAFGDVEAFGAIRAIEEHELKVPEDIAVVGFDDIVAAAYYNPPLTTVRSPKETMGEQGAILLMDVIEGRKLDGKSVVLEAELVVRESSGAPRQANRGGAGD